MYYSLGQWRIQKCLDTWAHGGPTSYRGLGTFLPPSAQKKIEDFKTSEVHSCAFFMFAKCTTYICIHACIIYRLTSTQCIYRFWAIVTDHSYSCYIVKEFYRGAYANFIRAGALVGPGVATPLLLYVFACVHSV